MFRIEKKLLRIATMGCFLVSGIAFALTMLVGRELQTATASVSTLMMCMGAVLLRQADAEAYDDGQNDD